MRRYSLAVVIGLAVLSSACTTPPALPTPLTGVCTNSNRDLAVGSGVAGDPDPTSAAFLADQKGRFDTTQFSDPLLYPPHTHWLVDATISGKNVVAATVGKSQPNITNGPRGGYVTVPGSEKPQIDITFDDAGAAEFAMVTQHAYDAASIEGKGSSRNMVAFFSGKQVLQAAQVAEPSSRSTSIGLHLPLGDPGVQAILAKIC